jgi:hypothetical protein
MAGLQPEAERAGFEPATDLSARTRFPVALLRPLGHLSETASEYPGPDLGGVSRADTKPERGLDH